MISKNVLGDLLIGKVDSTKNEIDGVDIEGFPTIKMFKKETNEEIEYIGGVEIFAFLVTKNVFTGKKDLESLVKFIETGEQEEADEEEEDYDEDYDDDFGDDEGGEDEDGEEDEVEEESTDAHDEL